MTTLRTYRVLVKGKFDRPDAETRSRMLAVLRDGGLPPLGFTEEGALSFGEHLAAFSFRCVVRVEPGEAEEREARDRAELRAMEALEAAGYPYRDLTSSATAMDDIKIRRRR
ncbi:DUF6204 family protein [Amycolatopsis anabasis]|uniref:DUF6204 family protein n=1 Tax=Amycolatopsis anabasis TaxID=1840409 RepID=UPI001FEB1774|nr:DUF6204 family protein [Amycolatopsis anabasis]